MTPTDPLRRPLWSLLLIACLPPLAAGWRRQLDPGGAAARRPQTVIVDLARDPAWRLALLPGIGIRRARDIVRDRQRHGPPRSLAELRRIPGLGPAILRRLQSTRAVRLWLDGRPLDAPPVPCPADGRPADR